MRQWRIGSVSKVVVLGAVTVLFGCAKQTPEAPPVGWHQESGWAGECWYPPPFEKLGTMDRRRERQNTLEAMMEQWGGERGDGVDFDARATRNLEGILLGRPQLIEVIARENLERCQQAFAGGDLAAWASWVEGSPARLMEGQCRVPFHNIMIQYLDINRDWQFPADVCEGDKVRISAASGDEFRLSEDGPWLNLGGDPDTPTLGTDHPCNFDGCYEGQLVLRFTSEGGMEKIVPVGLRTVFEAPDHGRIEVMVNDTSLGENVYREERGVRHHASIEYSPAD